MAHTPPDPQPLRLTVVNEVYSSSLKALFKAQDLRCSGSLDKPSSIRLLMLFFKSIAQSIHQGFHAARIYQLNFSRLHHIGKIERGYNTYEDLIRTVTPSDLHSSRLSSQCKIAKYDEPISLPSINFVRGMKECEDSAGPAARNNDGCFYYRTHIHRGPARYLMADFQNSSLWMNYACEDSGKPFPGAGTPSLSMTRGLTLWTTVMDQEDGENKSSLEWGRFISVGSTAIRIVGSRTRQQTGNLVFVNPLCRPLIADLLNYTHPAQSCKYFKLIAGSRSRQDLIQAPSAWCSWFHVGVRAPRPCSSYRLLLDPW